jgi:hypothetical protein
VGLVQEGDHVAGEGVQCQAVEADWVEGGAGVVISLQVEVEEWEVGNNLDRQIDITRAILVVIKTSIIDAVAHSVAEIVEVGIRTRHRHLLEDAIKGIPVLDEGTEVMEVALAHGMVHCLQALGVNGMKIGAPSQISRLLDWQYLSWAGLGVRSPSSQTNKGDTVSDDHKEEFSEANKAADSSVIEGIQTGSKTEVSQDVPPGEVEASEALASQVAEPNPHSPPSRIRIYFHTPVTADDSRPIPHNSSYSEGSMDSRKGKRKKLEDDDGDLDDIRVPPPPPQMAGVNEDHASVAGSVAHSVESASEADWLMAAIVEGEDESKAIAEVHAGEESEDGEQLQISEIVNADEHAELEGDGNDARIVEEAVPDGEHRHFPSAT